MLLSLKETASILFIALSHLFLEPYLNQIVLCIELVITLILPILILINLVPFCYLPNYLSTLLESVKTVQVLWALRYIEHPNYRDRVDRDTQDLEPEPVPREELEIETDKDGSDIIEDKKQGTNMVLPVGVDIFAHIDVSAIVDGNVEETYKKG